MSIPLKSAAKKIFKNVLSLCPNDGNVSFKPAVSLTCTHGRHQSSYQQEASHTLQASQSNWNPEPPLYNEHEVRNWLGEFKGGQVRLSMDRDTGLACITLANGGKRNALTGQMMVELADAIQEVEQWRDGRCVVLRGADGQFCSGGDLEFMHSIADPASGSRMCIFMQTAMARLYRLPLVSLALVEGFALGGGADIALAADFRVLQAKARMGFVQGQMGISPGWGGGTHLVRLVGQKTGLRLMSSCKILKAEECVKVGLADEIVQETEPDQVLAKCQEWLDKELLVAQPQALRAAKGIVYNVGACSYGEALNRERDLFVALWGTPEHLEAIEKQKRALKK